MKSWKLVCSFAIFGMLLSGCAGADFSSGSDTTGSSSETVEIPQDTDRKNGQRNGRGGGRGGNGGGNMEVQNDEEIQKILDENAGKFEQYDFSDEATGQTLEYSLFTPEQYDDSKEYPLIMFIPDATGSGKSAKEIVEQYYGAVVWAAEEEQAKHASFVMVPAFSETVTDDNWNVSGQVETAVHLIEKLQKDYRIDKNRIYTTGQSMGCMTSLYLNSKYPELFAASMYVSGQWDISVLQGMEKQKFFYITAGGDEKASSGQDEVMAMFDSDQVSYTYGTWDAQDSEEEQAASVEKLLAQGCDANMIRFEAGTVLTDGGNGMEHMASFNYGYKLAKVRDWLLNQSK